MQNYSYLQPPSHAHRSFMSFDHTYIEEQSKILNHKPRRIYSIDPKQYTQQQIQSLHRLKEYLKHKNPTIVYPDHLLLRFCHLGSFMTSDSKELFTYYEDWHAMQNCPRNVQKGIIHSGVFYCYGRDQKYCPTIYFHPSRVNLRNYQIQDYLVCLRTLLSPIEQYMLVPGKIQRWNIVVDLRDFKDNEYRDKYQIIKKNIMKILYAYPFRLKRLFIIQKRYSSLWAASSKNDIVHQLVLDLKLNKYCVRISNLKDLNKYIPPHERQRQYGGTLQNLCQFWPIQTTNRLTELNSRFIQQSEDSCDYESINNEQNAQFFAQSEQKKALCDLKKACNIF